VAQCQELARVEPVDSVNLEGKAEEVLCFYGSLSLGDAIRETAMMLVNGHE